MREYRLRTDLERSAINGFALPLGIVANPGELQAPAQGYTVAYTPGENDDPDTYAFHVVVSHERLRPIVHRAFDLLPDEVVAIIEIGSRDAYRATDVFISSQSMPMDEFREVWSFYESLFLEESAIAAGANNEEPFIEVFVDQWKGLSIHVPLEMHDEVEAMLQSFGLEEVTQTWPPPDETDEAAALLAEPIQLRPVLDTDQNNGPDVDELLLEMRHDWKLELNVDPRSNVDDAGRALGTTLWHVVVILESADGELDPDGYPKGAFATIWATAGSMTEIERLMHDALEKHPQWTFSEVFTIDRVAHDERPEALADLQPARRAPQVHLCTIDPWDGPAPDDSSARETPQRKSSDKPRPRKTDRRGDASRE